MSKPLTNNKKSTKKIRDSLGNNLKISSFKCPFCREEYNGLKEWAIHLKEIHLH